MLLLYSYSVMSDSLWPHGLQTSLSFTISWNLLKIMSIESVIPSNHLILCRPLLLLPSIFTSIRIFSSESALPIRWPKYWRFSFSNSPSNDYSGLISFRIDAFHLLAVQGTLKSLLQHHSSKASVLQCSAFFMSNSHRQRNQRSNCQHLLDHGKSKRVPEKHVFLLYWLCQSLWLCGSQ